MKLITSLHTTTVLHVQVPDNISNSEIEDALLQCLRDGDPCRLKDGITGVSADVLAELVNDEGDDAPLADWPEAVKEFLTAVDAFKLPDGSYPDEFLFHR
jgi:hypothetical protein